MKTRCKYCLMLCVVLLTLNACKKIPEPQPIPTSANQAIAPPQPIVEDTVYVSANSPGYFLHSADGEEIGSAISRYFLLNGTVQWKCLAKPDQAPVPDIKFPNFKSTDVGQLSKGAYVFEVTYSTKVAVKKAQTQVYVIDDALTSGSVILPRQAWVQSNWSSFPGTTYFMYTIEVVNRPDLFCFRQGKNTKVEVQNNLTSEWLEIQPKISFETYDDIPNPIAYLTAYKNLTIQYDPNFKPDSILNRLIKEEVSIRISY